MNTWFAVLILFAASVAQCVQACTCGLPTPPLKAFAKADAVFSGTVTKLTKKRVPLSGEEKFDGVEVTVTAAKSWKGNVAGETLVYTGTGMGNCGYDFQQDQNYLFYVYRAADGNWCTDVCARTGLLKEAANEILELEGRLPPPTIPARSPVLELKGRIRDAGYDGYIFTFHNRLHERIFYIDFDRARHRIQVHKEGKWIDYPANLRLEPRAELSTEAVRDALTEWENVYHSMKPELFASYLDRLSSRSIFVALPTTRTPWRVGFQYLTESKLDSGQRIQASEYFVWSSAIDAKTPAKELSFEEALAPEQQ